MSVNETFINRNYVFLRQIYFMVFDREKMLAKCNEWTTNTLMETLEIKYIDAGPDFLKASMPVNSKVHQPMGLLHGGATAALAESVGSAASIMYLNLDLQEARGIEITANHLRSKRAGIVYGTAKLIHKGRTIHLWEIKITDEENQLISLCRLTTMIVDKKK